MSKETENKIATRLVKVEMTFWKTFYVEIPDGVTKSDVSDCELVQLESSSWGGDVDIEHDTTEVKDAGPATGVEAESTKRHEKVFTWSEAQGE